MRPVNRGNPPTHSNGQTKLYKDYGNIRKDLISRIGEYCSYCETPLGANLAIEHMLSKVFSLNEIDWNNSLLACTNCNSHKKDKTLSENDLNNYYWPSINYNYDDAKKGIHYRFNTFDMLEYKKENATLQSLIDSKLLTLPKNRQNKPYLQSAYDKVWVKMNPIYAGKREEGLIKATICLMGLNDYMPTSETPKASDRRIENRTTAWTRAVLAADKLQTYYASYNTDYTAKAGDAAAQDAVITTANHDLKIRLLKKQIQDLAVATGFWSIWVTLFKDTSRTFINDPVRASLICELFGPDRFAGTCMPPINGVAGC